MKPCSRMTPQDLPLTLASFYYQWFVEFDFIFNISVFSTYFYTCDRHPSLCFVIFESFRREERLICSHVKDKLLLESILASVSV